MDDNRLQQLLTQYFDNTIARADCEDLLNYLDEGSPSIVAMSIDRALETNKATGSSFNPDRKKNVYSRVVSEIHALQTTPTQQATPHKLYTFPWMKIAALFMAAIIVGILLYENQQSGADTSSIASESENSITLPEHNQAILTLADGSTILLNDSLNGILAHESGVEIRKAEDGSIFYEAKQASVADGTINYNTFSTPKGSSYQILLPDGTKVWLNTATSIRFPVAFTGEERHVSLLRGEAYFEVTHNASKPFSVEVNGSTIQVLGTHFNVSAYADENRTTTTLVEGSVNVSKNGKTVLLKPNQQAVVDELTGAIRQSDADVRSVMAWKNGYFRFDDESIEGIIDKISRWYDIDAVEYEGEFNERFTGTFQRSKNIAQLFSYLEKLAPIRFEIKERRVVIMK